MGLLTEILSMDIYSFDATGIVYQISTNFAFKYAIKTILVLTECI